jgi:hypothetical protein
MANRCTQVYVLRSGRPSTPPRGHALDPHDQLLIHYERNHTGDGKWTQYLKNLTKGKLLDTLTAGDKPATK